MLAAWRRAGPGARPAGRASSARWTRVCFCGQDTPAGRLADHAVFGAAVPDRLRGGPRPALRRDRRDLRGARGSPRRPALQGVKVQARSDDDRTLEPTAVPLTAARIADRVIVTAPGRADRRARPAHAGGGRARGRRQRRRAGRALRLRERVRVLLHDAAGVRRAALRGRHHRLRPCQRALPDGLAGRPRRAPRPRPARPSPPSLRPDPRPARRAPGPSPSGAARGRAIAQPPSTARLGHAVFSWRGGASGTDRPLDRAFVSVQRRRGQPGRRWPPTSACDIVWRVADARPKVDGIPRFRRGEPGTYTAAWEPAAERSRSAAIAS